MKKVLIVLSAVLVSACAAVPYEPYAREVKKKPRQGGVIALKPIHRPEDRARADFLMTANCGESAVNVAEEGEVVVGEKTSSSATKTQEAGRAETGFRIGAFNFGNGDGVKPGENTNTQTETTQMKEWQIVYNCVAAEDQPLRGKKPAVRR